MDTKFLAFLVFMIFLIATIGVLVYQSTLKDPKTEKVDYALTFSKYQGARKAWNAQVPSKVQHVHVDVQGIKNVAHRYQIYFPKPLFENQKITLRQSPQSPGAIIYGVPRNHIYNSGSLNCPIKLTKNHPQTTFIAKFVDGQLQFVPEAKSIGISVGTPEKPITLPKYGSESPASTAADYLLELAGGASAGALEGQLEPYAASLFSQIFPFLGTEGGADWSTMYATLLGDIQSLSNKIIGIYNNTQTQAIAQINNTLRLINQNYTQNYLNFKISPQYGSFSGARAMQEYSSAGAQSASSGDPNLVGIWPGSSPPILSRTFLKNYLLGLINGTSSSYAGIFTCVNNLIQFNPTNPPINNNTGLSSQYFYNYGYSTINQGTTGNPQYIGSTLGNNLPVLLGCLCTYLNILQELALVDDAPFFQPPGPTNPQYFKNPWASTFLQGSTQLTGTIQAAGNPWTNSFGGSTYQTALFHAAMMWQQYQNTYLYNINSQGTPIAYENTPFREVFAQAPIATIANPQGGLYQIANTTNCNGESNGCPGPYCLANYCGSILIENCDFNPFDNFSVAAYDNNFLAGNGENIPQIATQTQENGFYYGYSQFPPYQFGPTANTNPFSPEYNTPNLASCLPSSAMITCSSEVIAEGSTGAPKGTPIKCPVIQSTSKSNTQTIGTDQNILTDLNTFFGDFNSILTALFSAGGLLYEPQSQTLSMQSTVQGIFTQSGTSGVLTVKSIQANQNGVTQFWNNPDDPSAIAPTGDPYIIRNSIAPWMTIYASSDTSFSTPLGQLLPFGNTLNFANPNYGNGLWGTYAIRNVKYTGPVTNQTWVLRQTDPALSQTQVGFRWDQTATPLTPVLSVSAPAWFQQQYPGQQAPAGTPFGINNGTITDNNVTFYCTTETFPYNAQGVAPSGAPSMGPQQNITQIPNWSCQDNLNENFYAVSQDALTGYYQSPALDVLPSGTANGIGFLPVGNSQANSLVSCLQSEQGLVGTYNTNLSLNEPIVKSRALFAANTVTISFTVETNGSSQSSQVTTASIYSPTAGDLACYNNPNVPNLCPTPQNLTIIQTGTFKPATGAANPQNSWVFNAAQSAEKVRAFVGGFTIVYGTPPDSTTYVFQNDIPQNRQNLVNLASLNASNQWVISSTANIFPILSTSPPTELTMIQLY